MSEETPKVGRKLVKKTKLTPLHREIYKQRVNRDISSVELAKATGYKHANNISMILTGRSKVALDKIPLFEKALQTPPGKLLELWYLDYHPAVHKTLYKEGVIKSAKEHAFTQALQLADIDLAEVAELILNDRKMKKRLTNSDQAFQDMKIVAADAI